MNRSSFPAAPTGAIPHLRELREANIEKNSSTLFTTETRSTRRWTENPDASVKSPCPPCLRGETGRLVINLFTRGGLLRPRLPARPTLPNRGWRGEGRSRLPRAQPKSAPRSLLALRRVAATLPPCTARTP